MGSKARLGLRRLRPAADEIGIAAPAIVTSSRKEAPSVRAMFVSPFVFDPDLSAEELRGFSRTVREIEWLLLVLVLLFHAVLTPDDESAPAIAMADRKSTRLNSSHLVISYAVFCLKKKK